jgi:hypothetical protein
LLPLPLHQPVLRDIHAADAESWMVLSTCIICLSVTFEPPIEKEGVRLLGGVGKRKREWIVAMYSISSQAKLKEYVGDNDRNR